MNRALSGMRRWGAAGAASWALWLCACGEPEWRRYAGVAMDTEIRLSVLCPDADRCDGAWEALLADAADWEARMGSHAEGRGFAAWSLTPGDTLRPDPDQQLLLARAWTLMEESGGRFDPALFFLKQSWGLSSGDKPRIPSAEFLDSAAGTLAAGPDGAFLPERAPYRPASPAPSVSDPPIQAEGKEPAAGPWVWQRAGSRLDLGGLAKGAAVDRWAARLDSLGLSVHLLQAGGDLRVGAAKPQGGWRVGIRHPRRPDTVCGVLRLRPGEAVSTSGDYERFFDSAGVRYHHIFDPLDARPAQGNVSVTVIAPRAAWADGLSTALFVLGPERGVALARRHGAAAAWFRQGSEGLCRIAMPDFAAQVEGSWPPACAAQPPAEPPVGG